MAAAAAAVPVSLTAAATLTLPARHQPLQAVFTNYGFHYPMTVALLQMAFIAPVSYIVARPQVRVPCRRDLPATLHGEAAAVLCYCFPLFQSAAAMHCCGGGGGGGGGM